MQDDLSKEWIRILCDRLQLTDKRLDDITKSMRHVSTLPSPLGRELEA